MATSMSLSPSLASTGTNCCHWLRYPRRINSKPNSCRALSLWTSRRPGRHWTGFTAKVWTRSSSRPPISAHRAIWRPSWAAKRRRAKDATPSLCPSWGIAISLGPATSSLPSSSPTTVLSQRLLGRWRKPWPLCKPSSRTRSRTLTRRRLLQHLLRHSNASWRLYAASERLRTRRWLLNANLFNYNCGRKKQMQSHAHFDRAIKATTTKGQYQLELPTYNRWTIIILILREIDRILSLYRLYCNVMEPSSSCTRNIYI